MLSARGGALSRAEHSRSAHRCTSENLENFSRRWGCEDLFLSVPETSSGHVNMSGRDRKVRCVGEYDKPEILHYF